MGCFWAIPALLLQAQAPTMERAGRWKEIGKTNLHHKPLYAEENSWITGPISQRMEAPCAGDREQTLSRSRLLPLLGFK